MKRDIIIIEDKAVRVTGNEVWMTAGEIAGLFHTGVPAVNAAIRAVLKTDVLSDYEVCRYIQLENGLYADVYSLEIIIPVAFRLNTYCTHMFRTWLVGKALSKEKRQAYVMFIQKSRVLLNTHTCQQKGNGQPNLSCPFPFFVFRLLLFQRLAVIRFQQFTQPRFGVKHLPA